MNPSDKVVTRFAPSPTGYLHAGSYRTALFAYIFAKQHHGKFILRIEDTDKERSKKEFEENIIESLEWLGLKHDEFYRQSERTAIYKKHLQALIDADKAYVSDETMINPRGDKTTFWQKNNPNARTSVIRFRNPNKKVKFTDLVRGDIEFDTTELGDFVLAKNMDEPIFHTVNVIDDAEMGVTHVVRGEDHISNTPRQILIYEALGKTVPAFAHIPLLLAADKSKLSKRNGALPVTEYKKKGFLPEALVNYFSLLGWHPADDAEILSFTQIVHEFSLRRVQKSGAVFDPEKLTWFNREYVKKLDDAAIVEHSAAYLPEWISTKSPLMKRLIPVLRDKIRYFEEVSTLLGTGGELHFVSKLNDYKPDMLLWKKNPDKNASRMHLEECKKLISEIDSSSFTAEAVKNAIWNYAESKGRGDVLWPLRVSLTGQEKSPDPFISAMLVGKDETIKRIDSAIKKLG